jgi:hypothetical protein
MYNVFINKTVSFEIGINSTNTTIHISSSSRENSISYINIFSVLHHGSSTVIVLTVRSMSFEVLCMQPLRCIVLRALVDTVVSSSHMNAQAMSGLT